MCLLFFCLLIFDITKFVQFQKLINGFFALCIALFAHLTLCIEHLQETNRICFSKFLILLRNRRHFLFGDIYYEEIIFR